MITAHPTSQFAHQSGVNPWPDDVFDLTARHADIHELPVVQAVQLGAFPLSFTPFFAPFLKRTPISPEELETRRVDAVVWAKP
jgi:hypothetical protein